MDPQDIHLGDLTRILIGEVPGSFFIEAFIRTVIIYAILMIAMRVMGKRMSARISRNELVATVSLAAAIGIPLQSPDRGIIPAIVIAIVVVSLERLASSYAVSHPKAEKRLHGNINTL